MLVVLSASALAMPVAMASPPSRRADTGWIPGEVVVRYRSDVSMTERASLRSGLAASYKPLRLRGAEVVKLASGESVSDAVAELEASPEVLYAEPNYLIEATAAVPNDPGFRNLWGLHSSNDVDIDAPEAWDVTTGSADVKVGVLDSGIDYTHPDLAPNIWHNPGESGTGTESNGVDDDGNGYIDDVRGWDFAGRDSDPMDVLGHGTHVAGTIGARGNDGVGVVGVNWNVSLVPLRVLGDDGVGSTADAANAIVYARSLGVSVINMSFGGPGYSRMMADAISSSPNMLFVASAGNDAANNDITPQYPCSLTFANVICVASSTSSDELSSFSNYGVTAVDLAAPGSYIYSTVPGGGYAWYSGTSMASPQVAGAAALLWAAAPTAGSSEVKSAVLGGTTGAASLAAVTATGGRLNANASLQLLRPPAPAPVETVEPAPATPVVHTRSVTFTISRRLVVRGVVVALDGFSACERGVTVKIKRGRVTVARVVTDDRGGFRARITNRSGYYSAVARQTAVGQDICSESASTMRAFRRR